MQRTRKAVVLDLQDISKSFGTVRANHNVSLLLHGGEVLALLGENGAGKSTLMSILFGEYRADSGKVVAFDKVLPPGSPKAAIAAGIGMVHQHFALAENASVIDNILVGTQSSWSPYLRRGEAKRRLAKLMESTGLKVGLNRSVASLTVGEKQRVEILKALYAGARILILDEPTAVLTPQEADQLFATVRELVADGMSVIFISHKLKEVMAVSDRIVVLRAGEVVHEAATAASDPHTLAEKMVGHDLPQRVALRTAPGEPILELRGARLKGSGFVALEATELSVRRHEIVGVAGVSGNGQLPLFELLSGLRRLEAGTARILGQDLAALAPGALVALGVGRIPEDRHSIGLLPDLPLWCNVIAETYREPRFSRFGFIRRRAARSYAKEVVAAYDVRTPSVQVPPRLLSGGNMQKLILGRNLYRSPALIVANQPTRGLDVGAVSFVHDRLEAAKADGAGILLISEDLDELLTLSDRLVVMFEGRVSTPLARADVSMQQLGLMMMGQGWKAA